MTSKALVSVCVAVCASDTAAVAHTIDAARPTQLMKRDITLSSSFLLSRSVAMRNDKKVRQRDRLHLGIRDAAESCRCGHRPVTEKHRTNDEPTGGGADE